MNIILMVDVNSEYLIKFLIELSRKCMYFFSLKNRQRPDSWSNLSDMCEEILFKTDACIFECIYLWFSKNWRTILSYTVSYLISLTFLHLF